MVKPPTNFFTWLRDVLVYACRYTYFVSCGTAVAIIDLWVLGTYRSRHRYVGGPGGAVEQQQPTNRVTTCAVTFHPQSTRRSRFQYSDATFVVHAHVISKRLFSSVQAGQRPVALVTGCSVGGIGWSTAVHLMIAGVDAVLLCRDGRKAADAMNAARAAVSSHFKQDYTVAVRGGAGSMRVVTADVGDVESMTALGSSLIATEPNLRIVVANAGYMACPADLTPSHLEVQMGTHVAGHGALLLALVDAWRDASQGGPPQKLRDRPLRVVVVSSAAAVGGHIPASFTAYRDVEALVASGYDRFQAYRDAKLSEAALAIALSRRIQRDNTLRSSLTVNVLHPGPIWSQVVPNSKLELPWLMDWSVSSNIFRMSPHASGLFVADLCLHKDFDAVSGHYFRMGADMTTHYGGSDVPQNWNTVWSAGVPSPHEAANVVKGEGLLRSVEALVKRAKRTGR